MAKIKYTKMALKQERDFLAQYTRFLPTLQLKKQQLQLEMRKCLERIASNEEQEKALVDSLDAWKLLFGNTDECKMLSQYVRVKKIETETLNIAGVEVPSYNGVTFEEEEYDLFTTPLWFDDAITSLEDIVRIRAEREVIRRQYDLIADELRVTTQRVNLFEKVKIPECKENIRAINIYLGDAFTSSVARSKIAKKKLQEADAQ